jgi:hypothetical protein
MILRLSPEDVSIARPRSPHSALIRVLRRIVPRQFVRGSTLVDDPAAHRLLRQIEAFGYRVRVWHDVKEGRRRLGIAAQSTWAMRTHIAYADAGPDAAITAATAIAEDVALEMEG